MSELSTLRGRPPIPDGEFALTWQDFHQIAALVHSEAGIVVPDSKVNLVYSRLAKRLRAIGLRTFREYCALVASGEGADERQALIAAMTTNVTQFFREPHHFEHMAAHVFPTLADAARRGERVRLWSSACSSGEEPYSMALTLLNVMPDAGEHDILILASDIDSQILANAEEGCYPNTRRKDIPSSFAGRFLQSDPEDSHRFCFAEPVRKLIRFRQLNLLKDWPIRGKFDVIMCRNVMIYFDQDTQNKIWSRFAEKLVPNGHLYIGHSERISKEDLPLAVVAQTTYRRAK